LQLAHLGAQGRLITDRRRHPAEQRGNLGPGLGEPEDVVDEQQRDPGGSVIWPKISAVFSMTPDSFIS
jgi:hypothetical protein